MAAVDFALNPKPTLTVAQETQASASTTATKSPVPGLDGIRAFAIAGVVAYHLRLLTYPGGVYGVDIFFVLSGFLISGVLLREWQKRQTLSVGRFYLRRLARLMPALIFMLSAFILASWLMGRPPHLIIREAAISISGAFNWFRLARVRPYDTMAHLWSLAIEFQFCLVWPLVVAIVLKIGKRLEAVALACIAIFFAVHAWRLSLINSGAGWHRLYFGSELRLDAFAAGALCQVLLLSKVPFIKSIKATIQPRATLLGLAGIVLHAVTVVSVNKVQQHMSSLWLAPVIALSAMAIILAIAIDRHSLFSRFFGLKIFTRIGLVSYGIYLWHYPIHRLLPRNILDREWRVSLVIFLAVVMGFISYYAVERYFIRPNRGGQTKELV